MDRGHDDVRTAAAAVEELRLHSPAGPVEAVYQWPFYVGEDRDESMEFIDTLRLVAPVYFTARQLARYRIANAGITEARLPGIGQRMVDDAILLRFGGTDHARGVALVLRPPLKNSLVT